MLGLIDWIVFNAVSAIFQPYNGGAVLGSRPEALICTCRSSSSSKLFMLFRCHCILNTILPQRPIKYIYLSCKILVPDLFQQIVFKLWHLVPLPSVDFRDPKDQPDKHHLEPAPILVSSILILLILKEYGSTNIIFPI